jgi:hypothetical protein
MQASAGWLISAALPRRSRPFRLRCKTNKAKKVACHRQKLLFCVFGLQKGGLKKR